MVKRKKNYLPLTFEEKVQLELAIKRIIKVIRYKVKKGDF